MAERTACMMRDLGSCEPFQIIIPIAILIFVIGFSVLMWKD
jgi:hypothetical protein